MTSHLGKALPWMAEGSCTRTDPEAFYPENGSSTVPAKRICNGHKGNPACPVVDTCLTYALAHQIRHGVWGGKSDRDRRRMLRDDPTLGNAGAFPCPADCGAAYDSPQAANGHANRTHPDHVKDAAA